MYLIQLEFPFLRAAVHRSCPSGHQRLKLKIGKHNQLFRNHRQVHHDVPMERGRGQAMSGRYSSAQPTRLKRGNLLHLSKGTVACFCAYRRNIIRTCDHETNVFSRTAFSMGQGPVGFCSGLSPEPQTSAMKIILKNIFKVCISLSHI